MSTQFISNQIDRTYPGYISSYPYDFESPIQKISETFPLLFPNLRSEVGGPIRIELVVDIPHAENEEVSIVELKSREISTRGLCSNERGIVSIADLAKQNITIGQESSSGYWYWEKRTICIAYSEGYGKYDFFDQEYYQILNLLFEMQNACQTPAFQDLDSRGERLGKDQYVREFEYIECYSQQMTDCRLELMAKQGKFDRRFNLCKAAYHDPELNYLFQQLGGHSFLIAEDFESRFPHHSQKLYMGTWATPFDRQNSIDMLVCEKLREILEAHLAAIYHNEKNHLERALEAVNAGFHCQEKWAQIVMENLVFFQKKYNAYVQRKHPDTVVNIVSVNSP